MAQRIKHLPTTQETQVLSLGWEDALEKEMATPPIFLPGKSHGQRSLVGYSPWGSKESDTTEWLHFKDQTYSHNLHFKITGLARRFNPETVLRQDTLLLYNPKECRGEKVCPFFLLENSRPLSPWGPLDFLSTCLGNDSLNMNNKSLCYILETNILLHIKNTSIFKNRKFKNDR